MSDMTTGGCLCGAVRYQVRAPLAPVTACHCAQCRRMTGSYWMSTDAPAADVVWTQTRGLGRYRASSFATRGFCRECGSTLFWQADGSENISITAGTLDGDTGLKTKVHIFVADKGDYYQIDDGLPQFPQGN